MPSIETKITIGNIISWALVIIGFVVGYTKLTDASTQNIKDTSDAKTVGIAAMTFAVKVKDDTTLSDAELRGKIASIVTDVAVIKADMKSGITTINEKLDDIRTTQKINEIPRKP